MTSESARGSARPASRLGRVRRGLSVAAVVTGALVAAGCSGPSGSNPDSGGGSDAAETPAAGSLKVAVVTHGSAGDAFWNVVKNGATDAGTQLGVEVSYAADGDPAGQAKLIDNAVAQKVGGIVVSMANPDALKTAIEAAVAAGVPVITINSGEARSAEFGALAHVGQSEGIAGQQAGQKLKAAGKAKLLCVIHEAGNIGLNQRCDGARETFGAVSNLQVDVNNPTDVEARIKGALQADTSIDAVLTLNPQIAANAVSAVKGAGSGAAVGTFDLNPDVVTAIKDGSVLFAIDQQQYEQGYLPVVMLKLYRDNANTVGGGQPVLTGPGFVDKSNVDTVAKYAERGTR